MKKATLFLSILLAISYPIFSMEPTKKIHVSRILCPSGDRLSKRKAKERSANINYSNLKQNANCNLEHINKKFFNISILETQNKKPSTIATEASSMGIKTKTEITQCDICLEEQAAPKLVKLSCNHQYCRECLEHIIDQTITEKTNAQLRCPNHKCRNKFTQEDIKRITNNNHVKIDAIAEITIREWLINEPTAKQCPSPDCTNVFLNENKIARQTKCIKCNQTYCAECLLNHPENITCRQANDLRPSDKETVEWLEQNTKACPNCNARVERNGGCLHITCKMCKKT